jgi:uncharacterized protein YaaQ
MKLVVSIVHSDDADALIRALQDKAHRCTRISTTGGFLREGNATILIGTNAEQVEDVLSIIRANCRARTQWVTPPPLAEPGAYYMPRPLEVQIGGATVFVLDVERDVKF